MLYLLAIVLPPIAVLAVGKPMQALLNFGLCFLGWAPGVIHAIFLVYQRDANRRNEQLLQALQRQQR